MLSPRRQRPWRSRIRRRGPRRRILISDFYGAYQQVERAGWIWAGCWVHARRPILRVAKALPDLAEWGATWKRRIGELYRDHRVWCQAPEGSAARAEAEAQLTAHLAGMQQCWTHEVVDPALPEAARNALRLMARHWDHLTQFLQDSRIPLDNNAAERSLRTPVVGRKNFQGSRAPWAAELAAMVWTLAETARQHGRDPLAAFTHYLEACAAAGGQPLSGESLAAFAWWTSGQTKEDTS